MQKHITEEITLENVTVEDFIKGGLTINLCYYISI